MEEVQEIYKGKICYFLTNDNRELGRSDSTENGTYMIANLCRTCEDGVEKLSYDGCYLDIEPMNYKGMWISDGTVDGTVHLPEMKSI